MNPCTIQGVLIGFAVGVCVAVPLMIRWHIQRTRDLWSHWVTGGTR